MSVFSKRNSILTVSSGVTVILLDKFLFEGKLTSPAQLVGFLASYADFLGALINTLMLTLFVSAVLLCISFARRELQEDKYYRPLDTVDASKIMEETFGRTVDQEARYIFFLQSCTDKGIFAKGQQDRPPVLTRILGSLSRSSFESAERVITSFATQVELEREQHEDFFEQSQTVSFVISSLALLSTFIGLTSVLYSMRHGEAHLEAMATALIPSAIGLSLRVLVRLGFNFIRARQERYFFQVLRVAEASQRGALDILNRA